MASSLYVMDRVFANALRYNGETVLTYEARFPQFAANVSMPGLAQINTCYKRQALYWVRAIQTERYVPAVAEFRERQASGEPFSPHTFLLRQNVTYMHGCVISLYADDYQFTGGAHGLTVRMADTWNAKTGERFPLGALFPPDTDYVALLTGAVAAAIHRSNARGEERYFENAGDLAREKFDECSFYLTMSALEVFYQHYDIAPYASGIPVFSFPYGSVGAAVPRC